MKKILFPTDFSKNANNALAYIVEIANHFGSEITLLHAYRVYSSAGSFVSVESYMKEDAAKDMLSVIDTLEPQLKNGAMVNSKIIKGETVSTIANVSEQGNFDLLVMGTQGASGLEEIFIGSTTNGVMKRTEVPVLAIPAGFAYRPIKTIALAVDEEENFSPNVLEPLLKLAKMNEALVRVYHKDEANDGLNTTIDAYLENVERTYHYELDEEHLNDSLNEFVAEQHADLLCMIRRKRGFLERIFHDSATTKTVFSSPVPLLILHDA